MRVVLAVCAGALLVSGCSDPKKASNGNFEKAIDAYLEKQPLCVNAPTSSTKPAGQEKDTGAYPAYVMMPTAPAGQELFQMQTRQFDALVKAGLLSARNDTISYHDSWSMSSDTKKLAAKVYDLTDTGRKALSKSADGGPFGDKFCYGTAQVDEVTQFTEPSPALGATVSSASYTYHVKDQAGWASDLTVQEAFPILKKATGDKLEGKTQLVLTNNGWVDARGAKL